jgi:hypothetical protein
MRGEDDQRLARRPGALRAGRECREGDDRPRSSLRPQAAGCRLRAAAACEHSYRPRGRLPHRKGNERQGNVDAWARLWRAPPAVRHRFVCALRQPAGQAALADRGANTGATAAVLHIAPAGGTDQDRLESSSDRWSGSSASGPAGLIETPGSSFSAGRSASGGSFSRRARS